MYSLYTLSMSDGFDQSLLAALAVCFVLQYCIIMAVLSTYVDFWKRDLAHLKIRCDHIMIWLAAFFARCCQNTTGSFFYLLYHHHCQTTLGEAQMTSCESQGLKPDGLPLVTSLSAIKSQTCLMLCSSGSLSMLSFKNMTIIPHWIVLIILVIYVDLEEVDLMQQPGSKLLHELVIEPMSAADKRRPSWAPPGGASW